MEADKIIHELSSAAAEAEALRRELTTAYYRMNRTAWVNRTFGRRIKRRIRNVLARDFWTMYSLARGDPNVPDMLLSEHEPSVMRLAFERIGGLSLAIFPAKDVRRIIKINKGATGKEEIRDEKD